MRNKLILIFSFVLSSLGVLLPESFLAMMPLESGELVIPKSSGGDDPFIIKLALSSFIISFVYTSICLLIKRWQHSVVYIFVINSLVYVFYMFLVSLSSSFIVAAKHGNWLPVMQFLLWLVSVFIISWFTFNKPKENNN